MVKVAVAKGFFDRYPSSLTRYVCSQEAPCMSGLYWVLRILREGCANLVFCQTVQ